MSLRLVDYLKYSAFSGGFTMVAVFNWSPKYPMQFHGRFMKFDTTQQETFTNNLLYPFVAGALLGPGLGLLIPAVALMTTTDKGDPEGGLSVKQKENMT